MINPLSTQYTTLPENIYNCAYIVLSDVLEFLMSGLVKTTPAIKCELAVSERFILLSAILPSVLVFSSDTLGLIF